MALHPQVANLLEGLAALGIPPLETQTPVDARAGMAAMTVPSKVVLHEVRDIDAEGVPVRLYRPSASTRLGLLVYLHGGGWVLGGLDSHDDVCRKLARSMGHAVLSVDYRLAPEAPFPAAVEDSMRALRWAHSHAHELGIDPTRIAIGGDSAGGNLAAVVANNSPVALRTQMLIYPVTDATRSSRSYIDNATGYRLTAAGMKWFCDHYLSGDAGSPDDPRVSPLFAPTEVLTDAPPAFVITAEFDPLRDEGEEYAKRLMAAGVPCTLTRWNGMIHGFFSMSEMIDDGASAIEQAAAHVGRALDV